MKRKRVSASIVKRIALTVMLGATLQAKTQDNKTAYPSMAPFE